MLNTWVPISLPAYILWLCNHHTVYHAVYGYYNPSTGLGYAEYMGAHIFTGMNLMIV